MRKIKISVSLDLADCRKSTTIKVDDDVSDTDIEEIAQDVIFDLVSWSWSEET